MNNQRILTGVKPTGRLHIGNYLGMIRPTLDLFEMYPDSEKFLFVANYHALNTLHSAVDLRDYTRDIAAALLSFGLLGKHVVCYKQSDVPEIFELTTILAAITPKGLINRAHAYKSAVEKNRVAGVEDDDIGINMGLYTYPLLMAADILLFNSTHVPVGQDQKQHVEIARDIAGHFNQIYETQFTLPEPIIEPATAIVPGTDGRKMSKSYCNTIPLFGDEREIDKAVKQIVTDSRKPEEPKDPESVLVYRIFQAVGRPEEVDKMGRAFQSGDIGYGDAKRILVAALTDQFREARGEYKRLIAHPLEVGAILAQGAEAAREIATSRMREIRKAVGAM